MRVLKSGFVWLLISISCNADEAKFRKDCQALLKSATTATVLGRDGWYFFTDELKHISNGAFSSPSEFKRIHPTLDTEEKNPVAVIVDLHHQLKALNIKLIVVPAPIKAHVYPDRLSPRIRASHGTQIPRLDTREQAFHARLKQNGVTVIDVLPSLLAQRKKGSGKMFCKTDTHWTSLACVQVARMIADEIKRMDWYGHVERTKFDTQISDREIAGDFHYLVGKAPAPPPETVPIRLVGRQTEIGIQPIPVDSASKVLLITDSFGKVFHTGGEDEHGVGAGLPDQLAAELGFPVDLLAASGSAIKSARMDLRRRAARDANYLPGKKVIIWCFAGRYLTNQGSEWSKVKIAH